MTTSRPEVDGDPAVRKKLRLAPMKPPSGDDDEAFPVDPAHLKNLGQFPDADVIGEGGDSDCGDFINLYLKLERADPAGRVVEAKFHTVGCGVITAAGAGVTEWSKGRPVEELGALDYEAIAHLAGLRDIPTRKHHCVELVLEAAHDAAAKAVKLKA